MQAQACFELAPVARCAWLFSCLAGCHCVQDHSGSVLPRCCSARPPGHQAADDTRQREPVMQAQACSELAPVVRYTSTISGQAGCQGMQDHAGSVLPSGTVRCMCKKRVRHFFAAAACRAAACCWTSNTIAESTAGRRTLSPLRCLSLAQVLLQGLTELRGCGAAAITAFCHSSPTAKW